MGQTSLYHRRLWFNKVKPHSTTIVYQIEFFTPCFITFSILSYPWYPSSIASVFSLPYLPSELPDLKFLVLDKNVHRDISPAPPNPKVPKQINALSTNFFFFPYSVAPSPTYLVSLDPLQLPFSHSVSRHLTSIPSVSHIQLFLLHTHYSTFSLFTRSFISFIRRMLELMNLSTTSPKFF